MQERETSTSEGTRFARRRVLSFPALDRGWDGGETDPGSGPLTSHLRPEDEWSHTIESARITGGRSVVICSLLIGGQRRDGIGSCESGIADSFAVAEQRALANAAEKFPSSGMTKVTPASLIADNRVHAASLSDMISGSQLRRLRELAERTGSDPEKESDRLFGCNVGELSREAASILIETLGTSRVSPAEEMKLAG